jgi:hypothetical protein
MQTARPDTVADPRRMQHAKARYGDGRSDWMGCMCGMYGVCAIIVPLTDR